MALSTAGRALVTRQSPIPTNSPFVWSCNMWRSSGPVCAAHQEICPMNEMSFVGVTWGRKREGCTALAVAPLIRIRPANLNHRLTARTRFSGLLDLRTAHLRHRISHRLRRAPSVPGGLCRLQLRPREFATSLTLTAADACLCQFQVFIVLRSMEHLLSTEYLYEALCLRTSERTC